MASNSDKPIPASGRSLPVTDRESNANYRTKAVSEEGQLSIAYSARAYATLRAGFNFCGKGASTCSS